MVGEGGMRFRFTNQDAEVVLAALVGSAGGQDHWLLCLFWALMLAIVARHQPFAKDD